MMSPPRADPVKILVVCTANRSRSPTAAVILRRLLTDHESGDRVRVESAGLCVYELAQIGEGIAPHMAAVAARHGYDLSDHVAQPLEPTRFHEYALVIVMEAWQSIALRQSFKPSATTVLTLRELAGRFDDPTTPDIAHAPDAVLESFLFETERLLSVATRQGPLADLLASAAAGGRDSAC